MARNDNRNRIDIQEDDILSISEKLMDLLLLDHTTHQNIFWATDDYAALGKGYKFGDAITTPLITGKNGKVIMPRVAKSREQQTSRSKGMAEVFTPSWICNAQNNLIDEAWFDRSPVFNTEHDDHTWTPVEGEIPFPDGKTWKDYVRDTRLEITCGEAPYLVSRYDATTGEIIPLEHRIGLLDRKLRIVSEHCHESGEWIDMAHEAYKNTYGYEWQGDNLLIARENLLFTFLDYYQAKFGKMPLLKSIEMIGYIISWNIFQMDGLKFCRPGEEPHQDDLFGPGNMCLIRDWRKPREKQKIQFASLVKK